MGFFKRLVNVFRSDGDSNTDMETLIEFTKKGDIAAIRHAVEEDLNVVRQVDDKGMTLLHWVAAIGNTDIAAMLLDMGAAIDAQKSDDDWTPLHFAALAGKYKMAAFLVKHGASIDAKDRNGSTPHKIARQEQQIMVVEVLEKMGAEDHMPSIDKYVQQGKVFGERQDWEEAIKSFTQALEVDSTCAEAHIGLMLAYAATLDMKKVKEHYAKLEQLNPDRATKFAKSPAGKLVLGEIIKF